MRPCAGISIVGLGLIGASIARAVRAHMPTVGITGYDADPAVRERAADLGIADDVTDTPGAAVTDSDMVMLCVPVGAMREAGGAMSGDLADGVVVSDVGTAKRTIHDDRRAVLPPDGPIVRGTRVAGTRER